MFSELTVGIVGGGGWLGRSIGAALLEQGVLTTAALILSSRSGRVDGFDAWPEARLATDYSQLAQRADVIVLSVRPEQFAAVAIDAADKLVMSFMAGVPLATLIECIGSRRVIRAMPNATARSPSATHPGSPCRRSLRSCSRPAAPPTRCSPRPIWTT